MGVEIERKFLVIGDPTAGRSGTAMVQGYVAKDGGTTVRVRVAGERAWLTVKGPSQGARRVEVEVELPVDEAHQLLHLCRHGLIEKTRYRIPIGSHTWEVDVFEGANAGLVVAEVELSDEDEAFERPDWLGAEVTADRRYANASLVEHPFSHWGSA